MIINDVNSLMRWQTSPLPTGYTQLNYLQSSGTQYIIIDSPSVSEVISWYVRFQLSSTTDAQRLFGGAYDVVPYNASTANVTRIYRFLAGTNTSSPYKFQINIGQGSGKDADIIGNLDVNEHIISGNISAGTVVCDGVTYTPSTYVFTPSSPAIAGSNKLFAFAVATSYDGNPTRYFKGKIFEMALNGSKLIPAMRDADSVVGLYNTSSNTFLTNAGTGTFTYG